MLYHFKYLVNNEKELIYIFKKYNQEKNLVFFKQYLKEYKQLYINLDKYNHLTYCNNIKTCAACNIECYDMKITIVQQFYRKNKLKKILE